ncbi:Cyclin-dependent kinase [Musa troglodytarum]|uniref:[RNA-polymerase]-subunit kinase n=1 Tax=Musa troglodytarum TaxID=320322 RepID=A0A9E7EN66_9LILI|nr:Cyclin-dependent kinase [Musa troglodytarum]
MAAGRHGGYRDHEFRDQEADVEVSRRKIYYRDRLRDAARNRDRDHGGRDLRDRVSTWQRGIRKREAVNGSCRSPLSSHSSGGSGKNQKRIRLSASDVEREAGELSSGSGSDDAEAPLSEVWENGTQNHENGDPSMSTGTRKFSPIVWDKDDNKQSVVAMSRVKSSNLENVTLPPPPPLPPNFIPPQSIAFGQPSVGDTLTFDVDVHVESAHEHLRNNSQETTLLDDYEEEFSPARSISISRWADGNNTLRDAEDEFFENAVPKRRKTILSDSEGQKSQETPTPELGEIITREDSGVALSKLSLSEGEDGDDDQGVEVDRNDYMVANSNESNADTNDQFSETDSEAEDIRAKMSEPRQPPQRCINMLQGCRSVDEFERLNKINEGTYGVVYRAKDKKTGEIVALKKVKMEKEREGFPLTSLREINILLSFHHPSIVDVKEVVVGSSLDSIFMVMEYMEHDLKGLMETMKQPFNQSEVKCLMLQLFSGVKYLHDNWVLHRSPELLLGAKEYSTAIDMWSLGYNKLREKFPPISFSGRPTLSEAGIDLLNKLLTYDPEKRITADAALNHQWFYEVPLPKSKDFMPTFPAQHAQDRCLRRIMKSPDPLSEQRKKELQQSELERR